MSWEDLYAHGGNQPKSHLLPEGKLSSRPGLIRETLVGEHLDYAVKHMHAIAHLCGIVVRSAWQDDWIEVRPEDGFMTYRRGRMKRPVQLTSTNPFVKQQETSAFGTFACAEKMACTMLERGLWIPSPGAGRLKMNRPGEWLRDYANAMTRRIQAAYENGGRPEIIEKLVAAILTTNDPAAEGRDDYCPTGYRLMDECGGIIYENGKYTPFGDHLAVCVRCERLQRIKKR